MRYLAAKALLLTLIVLGTQVQAADSPLTNIHRALQAQAHQQEGGKLLVQLKAQYQARKYALSHLQASQQLGEQQVLYLKAQYELRKQALTQLHVQELVKLFTQIQTQQQALAQEQAQKLAQTPLEEQAQLQTQQQAAKQALIQAQTQEISGVKAKYQAQLQDLDKQLELALKQLSELQQILQKILDLLKATQLSILQTQAQALATTEAQIQKELDYLKSITVQQPPPLPILTQQKQLEQYLVDYKATLQAVQQQQAQQIAQTQTNFEVQLQQRAQILGKLINP